MNRFILLGLLAVAFVLPAAAQADPGTGAEVSRVRQCDTFDFGTFCVKDHTVSQLRSTPSGNTVVVAHFDFTHSLVGANGTCSFEQSGKHFFHVVVGPHANVTIQFISAGVALPDLLHGRQYHRL